MHGPDQDTAGHNADTDADSAEIGTDEAARLLGRDPRQVRRLIQRGQLAGRQVPGARGPEWRTTRAAVSAYLEAAPRPRPTEPPPSASPSVPASELLTRLIDAERRAAAAERDRDWWQAEYAKLSQQHALPAPKQSARERFWRWVRRQ